METIDSSENVSLPIYEYVEDLKIYREKQVPENKIFRQVGYNDQDLIKKIMDLLNSPVMNEFKGTKLSISRKKSQKLKSASTVPQDALKNLD